MRLEEYFRTEARDYLAALERAASTERLEAEAVHRSARGLTGVARLAGEPRILRAATALERATRPNATTTVALLAVVLRESIPHFRVLIAAEGTITELEAHADAVVDRCTTERSVEAEVGRADAEGDAAFHMFVAGEASAIADVIEQGITQFSADPANRESIGAILRRQRALLGMARLDEVRIVAEALRAVEDVAELIVRLDVPVKSEWLDVFRTAKDVLRSAATGLKDGTLPASMPSLSRLRTLREELVDRYGDRRLDDETASAPEPASEVEIAVLRERIHSLRTDLINAVGANARARAAVEELHALALRSCR
jgi:hypothetical protein